MFALAITHLLAPASSIVLRKRLPSDASNTQLEIRFEMNVTVVNSTDGAIVRSMVDTCNVQGTVWVSTRDVRRHTLCQRAPPRVTHNPLSCTCKHASTARIPPLTTVSPFTRSFADLDSVQAYVEAAMTCPDYFFTTFYSMVLGTAPADEYDYQRRKAIYEDNLQFIAQANSGDQPLGVCVSLCVCASSSCPCGCTTLATAPHTSTCPPCDIDYNVDRGA